MTDSPVPARPLVAVQLWTLRHLCAADLSGTFRRLADAGVRWIEPYDWFGVAPAEFARHAREAGLGVATAHVGIDRLEHRLEEEIELHRAMGCGMLVCPWLDDARRATPECYERVGDILARALPTVRAAGMSLAYHNHDFEFTDVRDPDGLRRVLARAPGVGAQLDAYWAFASGKPAEVLARELGDRLVSIHVKDGRPREGVFTPAGDGEVGIEAVIRAGLDAGVGSLVLEQDEHEGDPIANVARGLRFVEGALDRMIG